MALKSACRHRSENVAFDAFSCATVPVSSEAGTQPEWRNPPVQRAPSDLPVIPIRFMKDGETLSYFSMLTTLATPQTIATQELRIESMFPMDEVTETRHARIMNQAQNVNH